MNKHIISGNISTEMELRYTSQNKAVLNFNIAVRRDFVKEGGQETDFFKVTSFGKTAETISKYFNKGDKILLSGRTQIDKVQKDGENRYYTNYIVDGFDFMQSTKTTPTTNDEQKFNPFPEDTEESSGLPF